MTIQKFSEEKVAHFKKVEVYINGYRLERTCYACPEQYDVYDQKGTQCAYIRLRHGLLRVDVPDVGHTIYSTGSVHGDGIFSDDERLKKLTECILKMTEWYLNTPWVEDT
jgi:hypothetical protein